MPITYRVTHRTDYRYEEPVTPSYGQLHVLPRDLPGQTCTSARVTIDPAPDDYRERTDFFGNRVAYFAIQAPHQRLAVTAESTVAVGPRHPPASGSARVAGETAAGETAAGETAAGETAAGETAAGETAAWETVHQWLTTERSAAALDARQFVLDSRLVPLSPVLGSYAAASFRPGRGLIEAAAELSERIHADFKYKPGSTTVSSPLEEVFAQREGVCQDFAHVAIAGLRALGLAARYVSGYLETRPPPGRPKLAGADVSHAWFSVYLPDTGWIDLDPTNDQFVNDRYVTTAWGRDYSDVPPLAGVIYTNGKINKPEVSVDVVPVLS